MRALLILVLAGSMSCAVGPDYERPVVPMPDAWRDGSTQRANLADLQWWKLFGDPISD